MRSDEITENNFYCNKRFNARTHDVDEELVKQ
jgi:hypothetical protein